MNPKKAILLIVLSELLIILSAVAWDGLNLEALHAATRFSGRLSLAIFSLIFLWNSKPEKLTNWLSEKFYLVFAVAHGIHLVELLLFVSLSGVALIPIRVLGGFVAYAMIFIMPLIQSVNASGKFITKRFSYINNFYQYYLWLIFFMTYLPRVRGTLPNAGGNYWEFVVLFIWVIVMLVIKITGLFKLSPVRNA
jgi:hypothetical protein